MFTKISDLDDIKFESNILKEYLEFKNDNIDYIVLFQIGTFFETFFEDAKIFSDVTGAQYTTRTFKTKICVAESGVNKDHVNSYIKKLLNENFKVCICSEFTDEYGVHYREVTRKYTQGTILEDEFLEISENNYLMAIYFKDNVYNISYADVSTGQIYKTQGDCKEYKIETDKISPKEILISKKQEKIFKHLTSKYNTTLLDEEYFKNSSEDAIEKYCTYTQKKFKTKLDKIVEYKCSSYMMLDEVTRKNLEFTRTNYLSKKRGSVLWFLNYTKTPMGIRLLKQYLNAPLLSKDDIYQRLDAVEELVQNQKLLDKTQNILSQLSDLSRLCSRISNITVLPKDLINLSRNSVLLKDLKKVIENLKSNLFKINSNQLNELIRLANTIDMAIKKDCANELKSGDIINEGYSAELDFLRNELNEKLKEVDKYCVEQKKKLELNTLKIKHSSSIGYYIEIPIQYSNKTPKEYRQKNSTSKLIRYTTNELEKFQENINSKIYKINNLEYKLYKEVRILASKFVELIRSLAQDIAIIDVLASFAKSAVENNLVKPEISGNDILIKNGYHPSLIKLNNELIKNDTCLKQDSMIILTGANMSGKSTYIKHNALMCILAQIGSFVPSDKAVLPIVDKMFFRQSSSDDIINNNSSFMVEMNDLKYILDNATNSSLILLDEPAKSTNAIESGAIARAFCEYMLNKYKTKTIIATHNLELTKLEEKYPHKVTNYIIGSNSENGIFDRKIRRGVMNKSYAINTALLAELPDEILKLAKSYIT